MVESIPQDPAKARQPVNQPHAKPTTAAAPTGTVAGRGNRITQFNELIVYALDNLTPKIFARRLKRGMYSIENNELQKYCNRCKEYWPADSEFFFATTAETDGLYPWCKACYLEWRYPHGRNKEALLKCKNDAEIEVLNCNFDDED